MKNRKWLTYTVGILLTLVVLTAVAGAGFRVGMMQSASITRPPFTHNFDDAPQALQGNPRDNGENQGAQDYSKNNGGSQAMQGNSQSRGFDNRSTNRGNDRRDGGFSFISPIFGLIRIVVLGLLLWIGYTFVKRSGWKLSLAKTSPTPAPVTDAVPSVAAVEEEKASE